MDFGAPASPPSPRIPPSVMPGLVPGIQSRRRLARAWRAPRCRKAWMPGTSPGMTAGGNRMTARGNGVSLRKPAANRALPYPTAAVPGVSPSRARVIASRLERAQSQTPRQIAAPPATGHCRPIQLDSDPMISAPTAGAPRLIIP